MEDSLLTEKYKAMYPNNATLPEFCSVHCVCPAALHGDAHLLVPQSGDRKSVV